MLDIIKQILYTEIRNKQERLGNCETNVKLDAR